MHAPLFEDNGAHTSRSFFFFSFFSFFLFNKHKEHAAILRSPQDLLKSIHNKRNADFVGLWYMWHCVPCASFKLSLV